MYPAHGPGTLPLPPPLLREQYSNLAIWSQARGLLPHPPLPESEYVTVAEATAEPGADGVGSVPDAAWLCQPIDVPVDTVEPSAKMMLNRMVSS